MSDSGPLSGKGVFSNVLFGPLGATVLRSMQPPKPPSIPAPPPAANPSTSASASVVNSGNNAKLRAAAGAGGSTNSTSGQGLVTPATTQQSVLLG
jgi:hypothetical protein